MDATQQILDSLRRIHQALRTASRRSHQKIGLNAAQLFVLQRLKEHEPLSLNSLAEKTFSHQSTLSVVVNELVNRELVKRETSEEDRRRLNLRLTKAGRALLKKRQTTIQELFVDSINHFSQREKSEFARLISEFVSNAGLGKQTPHFFFTQESEDSGVARKRKK